MKANDLKNKQHQLSQLKDTREGLRQEWRNIREERLERCEELFTSGKTVAEVRHDRIIRTLIKKQRWYSVRLSHLDRKISRHLSHYPEK